MWKGYELYMVNPVLTKSSISQLLLFFHFYKYLYLYIYIYGTAPRWAARGLSNTVGGQRWRLAAQTDPTEVACLEGREKREPLLSSTPIHAETRSRCYRSHIFRFLTPWRRKTNKKKQKKQEKKNVSGFLFHQDFILVFTFLFRCSCFSPSPGCTVTSWSSLDRRLSSFMRPMSMLHPPTGVRRWPWNFGSLNNSSPIGLVYIREPKVKAGQVAYTLRKKTQQRKTGTPRSKTAVEQPTIRAVSLNFISIRM